MIASSLCYALVNIKYEARILFLDAPLFARVGLAKMLSSTPEQLSWPSRKIDLLEPVYLGLTMEPEHYVQISSFA